MELKLFKFREKTRQESIAGLYRIIWGKSVGTDKIFNPVSIHHCRQRLGDFPGAQSAGIKIITDHLSKWDAFVAAWLPGTEGDGIAQVLFGDYPFTGKLSFTWPRSMGQIPLGALRDSSEEPLFTFGYGLI